MKPRTLLLSCLALAVITAGCDQQPTTSEKIAKLQTETKAAEQDFQEQDYTFAQKTEFTAKLKSQLAEINRELDVLAAKIEKSSAAAKAEAQPKLQALRDQSAKLSAQLDETQSATESTWESMKTSSKKAYNELKVGFTQARQWVSEKIAP